MAQNSLKLGFFKKCIYTLAAMWVKAEGYYSSFNAPNTSPFMVSMGIGQLYLLLGRVGAPDFIRIGRSYIINMKYVIYVSFTKSIVRMADEKGATCALKLSKNELRTIANYIVTHQNVYPISASTPSSY